MKKQKELVLIKSEGEIAQAEAQIVELSKRIEFYLTEYSVELLANKMSKCEFVDRKSTRLNSSHSDRSRMPSSA